MWDLQEKFRQYSILRHVRGCENSLFFYIKSHNSEVFNQRIAGILIKSILKWDSEGSE